MVASKKRFLMFQSIFRVLLKKIGEGTFTP